MAGKNFSSQTKDSHTQVFSGNGRDENVLGTEGKVYGELKETVNECFQKLQEDVQYQVSFSILQHSQDQTFKAVKLLSTLDSSLKNTANLSLLKCKFKTFLLSKCTIVQNQIKVDVTASPIWQDTV